MPHQQAVLSVLYYYYYRRGDSLQFRHTSIVKALHSETPPLRNIAVPTLPPKHSCSEIKHRYLWFGGGGFGIAGSLKK